ncbi:tyrosine-type recombinase/integrase [Duganella sp. FT134W]|uniref:Tyrosine-type recombinase/integrase n=1 Tax=Duganella margarita TaxID=2692170 RepID=A0A7X4H216_9BURK|nr:site-specific integrase [Duganella margarita]MYM73890.1 tyrosine-type recombinase/integrase [Duganella margarita]
MPHTPEADVDFYLDAATRPNTRRSYASAVRHFEVEWGGFLPASADAVAQYLVGYAGVLATSTLTQRLAALAQWHLDQGFPDPTKVPLVRKVMRGIRAEHPAQEKQAKPLQIIHLSQVDRWLGDAIAAARAAGDCAAQLRHTRDRALVLLGFWRGFRGDELTSLQAEHVQVAAGEGMSCYFPRTKGDRQNKGVTFQAPALARLCPVSAYQEWVSLAHLDSGPAFRAIDRWGHVGDEGLHPNSLIALLRSIFTKAGVADADEYSGHSLRRGFANWADADGWDTKSLMEYVGWRSAQSAMRYIDSSDRFARYRPVPLQQIVQPNPPADTTENAIDV